LPTTFKNEFADAPRQFKDIPMSALSQLMTNLADSLVKRKMDLLSTTASVIAVIQLSSEVVKYVSAAGGATKERKRLREEVRACEYILQQLKDEADDSEEGKAWSETIKALEAPGAPLGRLCVALSVVKAKL
jgi:hypothetical protein